MNDTIPSWRIEVIIKTLRQCAADSMTESEKYAHNYLRAYPKGRADAQNQAAKWLEEIVEKSK